MHPIAQPTVMQSQGPARVDAVEEGVGRGGWMHVVILCGGKGTRVYPYSEHFPKPMMPIGGTPILAHIMRLYAQQGFTNFVLAGGHRIEILRDYFGGRFNEWNIEVVDTGADSDTGERIRRCAPFLDGPFFATYGDGIGAVRLHDLLTFHKATGGIATVTTVPLPCQYGTVLSDADGRVSGFLEKPVLREYWINAGFFVFEREVFKPGLWEGQSLEREVLPNLAKKGVLYSYRHEGFWKCLDTSKDQQALERLFEAGGASWTIDLAEPE